MRDGTEAPSMKKPIVIYLLLVWSAVMAVQCVRSIEQAFVEADVYWKLGWMGVSEFYAIVAYGAARTFIVLRTKNSG
jgi:hypothetical protein